MADIDKVKRNIKRMIDAGAPKEDIDSYLSIEGVSAEELKQTKTINTEPVNQENKESAGFNKKDLAITAGAIGAGALAKEIIFSPAKQIKSTEKKIDNLKKSYLGRTDIASQDVPAMISSQGKIEQQKLSIPLKEEKINLAEIKLKQQIAKKELARNLQDFDNTILSKNIDELGDALKTKTPEFLNNTYNNYGKFLDNAELKLISANKQLSSDAFISNVLNKTIDDAIAVGVPEEKLGKLISFRNNISSKGESQIIDQNLKPPKLGKPATVKQLKGNIRFLGEDIPKEAKFKLRENWGNFLEKNAPEVSEDLANVNRGYAKVSKLRNALYKTVDEASGEFDKTKLNRMLTAYAKSNVETGLQETINLMAQGNEIASGVVGVKEPFKKLQSSKTIRKGMQEYAKSAEKLSEGKILSTTAKINDLNKQIEASKLKTLQWEEKANRLLSKQKNIATKHPFRSGTAGTAIRKAGGVAERAGIAAITRGAVRALPTFMMISSAVHAFTDPVKAIGEQLGVSIPDKGTKERAVLENFANKTPIPEEMNVSEEDRFKILTDYGFGI